MRHTFRRKLKILKHKSKQKNAFKNIFVYFTKIGFILFLDIFFILLYLFRYTISLYTICYLYVHLNSLIFYNY